MPLSLQLRDAKLEQWLHIGDAAGYDVGLAPGTYYLQVSSQSLRNSAYRLALTTRPPPDAALEPNDSFDQATPITLPYSNAQLQMGRVDEDWFSFTLAQAQVVTISSDAFFGIEIRDAGHNVVHANMTGMGDPVAVSLSAGSYRIRLWAQSLEGARRYSMSVSARSPGDAAYEPNDTRQNATPITLPFARTDLFTRFSDPDWYRFTLDRPTTLEVSLSQHWGLLTPADNEWDMTYIYTGTTVLELPAGSYYLNIQAHMAAFYNLSISPQ